MREFISLRNGAAMAAALMLASTPALAGKADRARSAIAEAQGKIDAADKIGLSGETPHLQAEAEASLRQAREDLKSGHKEAAISEANRASQLADTALGEAQRRKNQAEANQRASAEAAAAAAQQQTLEANARAAEAQQNAAAAAADAAAARAAAAPVVVAQPATTTVTTQTEKVAASSSVAATRRPVKRTVVHRRASHPAAAVTEKTTTTVTTTPN